MTTPKSKKKGVCFAITPELDTKLSALAYRLHSSKSSLVEEWIFEKVEYYENMEDAYAERFKTIERV